MTTREQHRDVRSQAACDFDGMQNCIPIFITIQ
jgi:hypothetical protein